MTHPKPPRPEGFSDPLTSAITLRDREVLDMVDQALREGRTALAFQPVVLARDKGRVAFYEGLIRILDTSGRIIPAREFITAVETRETGRLIDCAALTHGLTILQRVPDLRLSINMSARSIGYGRWMNTLHQGLKQDDTLAERLILEITESSAMMMPEVVSAFMDELHGLGIAFALDDFGAGYTAFRYFREFFFDMVKIDGQFIRNVASNPDNQVLTRALTSIGQHFDMLVVAEAVESQADADWLASLGVDCMQGYHFAAPMLQPDWLPRPEAQARRGRAAAG
ncbi:EAL domain-containing protein [Falsigemmobacter intermedius]|uniref:EAL domain-containing protein n=1 Tax=Falsigemmobacter intermedius TaxID=1553448 RepID=A0A3S3WQK9_9RHOB|nr:EAL domain-containing protein [Falsigemmobacter intermedius]RWY42377.1 EAL domain-containing protein [Falsigemmobacter intermedius]